MKEKASFDYVKELCIGNRGQELYEAVPAWRDYGRLINVACELFVPHSPEDDACIGDVCCIEQRQAVANAEDGPLLLHRQYAERIIADLVQIWEKSDREINSEIEKESCEVVVTD